MKKFIFINGILLFIFLLANFFVGRYINQSIEEEFVGEFEVFELGEEPFDYVNVGTSHGSVSFNWKTLNLNGLNLAKSGQPLIEDAFLLDQHSDHFNEETLVIIPISFHTFCMEQELSAKTQSIYLDPLKLLGMVRSDRVLEYIFDRNNGDYPPDDFNFERFTPNSLSPSECDEPSIEESTNAVIEIINEYPNSVLVTTPYYVESLSIIDEFQDFYEIIDQISKTSDTPYYDYSRDERFNDTKYFYNNTHLNTLGREQFTKYFYDEVLNKMLND